MNVPDLYVRMDLAATLHLASKGHILAVRSTRRNATHDYLVTGPDKDHLRVSFTGRLNMLMDEAFASGLIVYGPDQVMRLTGSGKAFMVGFYGEIDTPGPKPDFQPLGAYGPDSWTKRETIEMRRDQLLPGNIVHSSHGIRFQIEAVLIHGAVTQIWNGRHGFGWHSERYDSHLTIPVETASLYPQQQALHTAGQR